MNSWPMALQIAMVKMCVRIDGFSPKYVRTSLISIVITRPSAWGKGGRRGRGGEEERRKEMVRCGSHTYRGGRRGGARREEVCIHHPLGLRAVLPAAHGHRRKLTVNPDEKRLAYIIIASEETPNSLKTLDCQLEEKESQTM